MGGANYMNNYMYMDPVFLNENGNDAYFNQSQSVLDYNYEGNNHFVNNNRNSRAERYSQHSF